MEFPLSATLQLHRPAAQLSYPTLADPRFAVICEKVFHVPANLSRKPMFPCFPEDALDDVVTPKLVGRKVGRLTKVDGDENKDARLYRNSSIGAPWINSGVLTLAAKANPADRDYHPNL